MTQHEAVRRQADFFEKSAQLVCGAVEGISEEQFRWQPAADSRSICGILRHLIRVDLWFMGEFGHVVTFSDPGERAADQVLGAFREGNREISAIISSADTALGRKLDGHPKIKHSFAEIVLHICHHYLYHYSQMVYLRRAGDRAWVANLKEWEALTYQMGADATMIKALLNK